ncbi:phiSA1p31-related protein [Streptomyces ardesiacus]|uniref:phiSA1p31-related protein n=1 Tax=Streptomyces ardesiacus TaxID=285564 RepID=UPI00366343C7
MGEQTFKAGTEVTRAGFADMYTVAAGPFQGATTQYYVLKREDGTHKWAGGDTLTAYTPKPVGYRKRDRAKVGSTGVLGLGELVVGPFRMTSGYGNTNGWLVRLDNDGTHVLAPERMLDVVERPERPEGHVNIKGTTYSVGSGYRYKDRDGDVWNTRSVNGMARACLTCDGTPDRNSFTLAHVVNAHGPLTRV